MWNRKSRLSPSEKSICLLRKPQIATMAGNKPKIQASLAVQTPKMKEHAEKKNALARLRALYPASSGESSSEAEMSDDNGDDEGRRGDKTTETCEFLQTEVSGTMKENKENSKSEDQSKLEVKEVDNQKFNGYSVGALLSQLRSEDAAKQSKFKISIVQRNARTDSDLFSQPPKDCSKLQIHQNDRKNILQLSDDPYLTDTLKNGSGKRNGGAKSKPDVAVSKESSIEGNMERCLGRSEPNEDGEVIGTRSDESLPLSNHTGNLGKSFMTSIEQEELMMGHNPLLMTRDKEVVPLVFEDPPSGQLVGQLVSTQAEQAKNKNKEKPVGVDTKPLPTHQEVSPTCMSQAWIKYEERDTKDQLLTKEHLVSEDTIEEFCRKEAKVTEDEHRSCMKGLGQLQMIASTQVELVKDVSSPEDGHSNLPKSGNVCKTAYIIQEDHKPSECNLKQAVVEVQHPETHSEVVHMVEIDLHSPVMKSKVDQEDTVTVNLGPASLNSAIETEGTGSVPSEEVQYDCARQRVRALVNQWKVTKKVQDIIEDSEKCITGDETVKVENDQPQEMKDKKSDENCTILEDSSHDLCRNYELPLQDNKQLTLERRIETGVQCENGKYVKEGSGDGAVEAEMGSQFHLSPFPQSTEDTLERPMDDQKSEGERAEEPGRDGADESTEWNDEALQESDFSSIDLTRECPAEGVIHLSSLEKSRRLCIPDKMDDPCLKMDFDPEEEERSLHEAGDDFKMKLPGSSGLETNQRGDGLGMQDMKPEENLSGNSSDGVPTSYVHREVEEQSSIEKTVESEEASAIDQTRKIISRDCSLKPNAALDVSQGPDTADTDRGDLSVPSVGSETINEEVISPVCQELDQSMDGSLMGLSDALDLEFGSNSPSPIIMKNLNIGLSSVRSTNYAFNMKTGEIINASLIDTCDGVEGDVTKDPNSSVDDDSSRISRSASPFAEGNESAEVPTSDHIQEVFTFKKEREALDEDFNHPSSELPREGDEGPVTDQSDAVVSEFDMLISHETHQDVEEGTLQETFLNDLVSEQDSGTLLEDAQEEPLSTSHLAEELTENDDALSLVCDAEDLMSNLDDLLHDESLQLSKQSPETDETLSISESTKSTSTKDTSVTDAPRPCRSSCRDSSSSPQRSRVSARGEERAPGESKQGYKVSIHSRNGNARFVYKNQESHRAVVERSPKRVTGPNRNWSANKQLSASERLALHQRLDTQNAANTSPNMALQQMMRNGPAIQHSGILQHQLQQQQQQELQRQLQHQLPPALQLRLGLIKNNTGLQQIQNTSDDIAIICQRQQVMVEKIIQLYQKQRESDVLMEKQRDIIRHYQRAFLIAKKGGPLSMREVPEEGNLRPCTSPRPRSPSPSADSDLDRQIGRKWPLSDHREERIYEEHPEAKRMKRYHGNLDMNEHSVERFSKYPDEEHPQRHVEHRIVRSRGNPVRSGPGSGSDFLEGRQPGNPRFQSEEQLLISVPTNHPEDEIHQERKCILQRSSPIFSGTSNHPYHPHPHCDDERVGLPIAPFLKRDVPRETSPLTGVEEYGDHNLDARSPCKLQRGFPHQGPCGRPGHTCQEKRTSSAISCQGRRTPSPLQSNWESCRITERDQRTGTIIDYYHTSLNRDHPQVGRKDMQETPPPCTDLGRQDCPSPLDEHPPVSRVCFPDNTGMSQGPCRRPIYPNGFHGQGICRVPLRPPVVDNACRAPLRPPAVDIQGNWRAPMGPPLFGSRAQCRAPMHPSVVGHQGACRAPMHPSVVAISHHLVAQNFEGVLPRIPHPPGRGLLESQMQSRFEYRQEHDCRADGQFGEDFETGFDSEWDNEFHG